MIMMDIQLNNFNDVVDGNFSNNVVDIIYLKQGPFQYTSHLDRDYEDRQTELKQWLKLQNGAKYEGHWAGKEKHGRGTMIWPDGSRYDGYWRND